MTSIYEAIETISIRCRWLKTETVDCQKWELFPPDLFSITKMYKKYLDSILTPPASFSLCVVDPTLHCHIERYKKALPRKWRLHSFCLRSIRDVGREQERERRMGGRAGQGHCLLHLSQWQGQFARDERYDCKYKKVERKKNTQATSSKCYRFPLSYFGKCEPKSSSESSTAANSSSLCHVFYFFVFFSIFFVLCWLTDKSLKHASVQLEGSANWPRRCDMTLGIIWHFQSAKFTLNLNA